MSDLGTLCEAVAAMLGLEDTERTGVQIRIEARDSIRANQHREFFWNVKETTITPLSTSDYIYAQGATSSDLPQDWIAPMNYRDQEGNPTAWITTTADTDTHYEFRYVSWGEYRRLRKEYDSTTGRPEFWTMQNESLYLVPLADVTTYIITLNYIYDVDENFNFSLTDAGAWNGSNDAYTSDWYAEDKGFHFLRNDVCRRMRRGPMKDPQNAQGSAQGAAEQLMSMTARAEKNVGSGRRAWHW